MAKDHWHLLEEPILKDFSAICGHERIWEKLWDIFSRSVYQHQSVVLAPMLHCQVLCGYRGVEGGTSDLVNWEGPWMPRGPDLGVLPSLHGVMYKHWIIKLHLSFSLHPARSPLPALKEASSLFAIERPAIEVAPFILFQLSRVFGFLLFCVVSLLPFS